MTLTTSSKNGVDKLIDKILDDWGIVGAGREILPSRCDKAALIRIAADLDALYRNPKSVRSWLNYPLPPPYGQTPIALLWCGRVQPVQDYVDYLSGR